MILNVMTAIPTIPVKANGNMKNIALAISHVRTDGLP